MMTDAPPLLSRLGSRLAIGVPGAAAAASGLALFALAWAPWFTVPVENAEWITDIGGTPLVGYHTEGDRTVLRGVGGVMVLLGLAWAFRPTLLIARPLLITAAVIGAAWATLPIVEAGTVPSRSGAQVAASWGPWGALIVCVGAVVYLAFTRGTAATGVHLMRAAYRADGRGRAIRAISLGRRALVILERTLGPDDPATITAAIDYASYLINEGYTTKAEVVLDAVDSRIRRLDLRDHAADAAEVRSWLGAAPDAV